VGSRKASDQLRREDKSALRNVTPDRCRREPPITAARIHRLSAINVKIWLFLHLNQCKPILDPQHRPATGGFHGERKQRDPGLAATSRKLISVLNMQISPPVKAALTRFCRSRSGNIAIISALAMPCLVGFCGMGGDVGYWYYRQRVLQAAADVTAFDGAVALSAGASASSVTSGASTDATSNGWHSSQGTITVNTPPQSGNYQNANSVEVVLTETEPRYFSNLFSGNRVSISVRAVANYKAPGQACMLALDKTAKNALQFWGNNTTTLSGCNVMSDSLSSQSLSVGGSSTVTVPCAIAVGGVYVNATLDLTSCPSTISHAEPVPDPYADLPAPDTSGPCQTVDTEPGRHCNGLSFKDTETLSSGVYIIDGGTFSLDSSANITGSNVMFYLTNGATLKFNGNATFNLSAPTSGTYSGILFYSDRTQSDANQQFNGTSSSVLTGVLYFPTQALSINGNYTGANGCMQVVADTISYSGNATLSGSCSAYGMDSVPTSGGTTLVE
jgi:Flp pilus assembly protein TadG